MSFKTLICCMAIAARPVALVLAGMALLVLGGCLFVTDTSRMDSAVFTAETAPVWDRPVVEQPLPQKPEGLGNLYQTQFHQTYGAQSSQAPVSSFATR